MTTSDESTASTAEGWRLPLAVALLVTNTVAALVLASSDRVMPAVDAAAWVAAIGSAVVVLALVGAVVSFVRGRLLGDHGSVLVGVALVGYALLCAATRFVGPSLGYGAEPFETAAEVGGALVTGLVVAGVISAGLRSALGRWALVWSAGIAAAEAVGSIDGATAPVARTWLALVATLLLLVGAGAGLRDAYARTALRLGIAEDAWMRLEERSKADEGHHRMLVHDARSALLAIEGAIHSLRSEGALTDERTTALTAGLCEEAERLRRLMDSPVGGASATTVDVRGLLDPMAAVRSANGVRVLIDVPSGIEVLADPALLRRAVANLLDNVVRHAPGSAAVVTARRLLDGSVELAVNDRGPGIAPERRKRMFEAGVTTGSGQGLGLASCRESLAAMGGTIRYEDNPGGGASFVMSVPASPPVVIDLRDRHADADVRWSVAVGGGAGQALGFT